MKELAYKRRQKKREQQKNSHNPPSTTVIDLDDIDVKVKMPAAWVGNLTQDDKGILLGSNWLNDKLINSAQR